ncbi:hypothetical protein SKTS_24840 [Sulfurimicrobium lacus]|uniref:Outer membrane lipoprotein-sorting protein n=1 Tax=Sulfurimicrobium lacus TaxID=2715678 RepID=A0A6F8VD00_9PROT|nr:hypothetical protein [Sulfurimicrobium lacus]BCB27598.1 hypothetical protein SKTS_24840 [Sulfurimicrobium lacus]
MRKIAACVLACWLSTVAVANVPDVVPELTAAQIIEKNVAARGGLEAWRKIQSMVWVGHIERPNANAPSLPYVLEQKRPNKTRFQIKSQNQVWVRIYDGTHGWKLRPARNVMPVVEQYTAEELRSAQNGQESFGGPLMDYQAKGIAVALDGVDDVEGHKAYRLSVKFPSGASNHVWVDAETFLEVKYDRQSRSASGQSGTVSVYYRNYGTIEGLQMPLMIESGADTAKATDKMVIDKVLLNPPLEEQIFARPSVPGRPNAASVNMVAPQSIRKPPSTPTSLPGSNPRIFTGSGVAH